MEEREEKKGRKGKERRDRLTRACICAETEKHPIKTRLRWRETLVRREPPCSYYHNRNRTDTDTHTHIYTRYKKNTAYVYIHSGIASRRVVRRHLGQQRHTRRITRRNTHDIYMQTCTHTRTYRSPLTHLVHAIRTHAGIHRPPHVTREHPCTRHTCVKGKKKIKKKGKKKSKKKPHICATHLTHTDITNV